MFMKPKLTFRACSSASPWEKRSSKAGTPVAKLVPVKKTPKKRVFGSAKGDFTVPDDFNDPDPEIEDLFYNGSLLPK